jgi:hypothetical protein
MKRVRMRQAWAVPTERMVGTPIGIDAAWAERGNDLT